MFLDQLLISFFHLISFKNSMTSSCQKAVCCERLPSASRSSFDFHLESIALRFTISVGKQFKIAKCVRFRSSFSTTNRNFGAQRLQSLGNIFSVVIASTSNIFWAACPYCQFHTETIRYPCLRGTSRSSSQSSHIVTSIDAPEPIAIPSLCHCPVE